MNVQAEDLSRGIDRQVCEGYFFMVSLDRSGKPSLVPPLLIENEEQQKDLKQPRKGSPRQNRPSKNNYYFIGY